MVYEEYKRKALESIVNYIESALASYSKEELEARIKEALPKKESEEERIRKFLVKHVSEWIGCIEHDLKISSKDVESEEELAMFKAGLAYLEKQKDIEDRWIEDREQCFWDGVEEGKMLTEKQKDASKAIEAVDKIDKYIDEHLANAHEMKDSNPDKKYYRGWDDALAKMSEILQDVYSGEKQKEQKPKQSEDEKEYVRTLKSLISDFLRGKDEIDRGYYQKIYDWLEGRHIEQKPINQCNTHEPTLDEARKWNEAYEKGYSLGYEKYKRKEE